MSDNDFHAIKADVIIDFITNYQLKNPIILAYVRPESNEVNYEKSIIKGLSEYGEVIYLANLNGRLFIRDALITAHYSSQYRFSVYPIREMEKYPEIINDFEEHFHIKFKDANIIGPFDAILKMGISDDDLFNRIVDKNDFLKFCGQTIKRIGDYFVTNYNIPYLIKRYNPQSNIFVITVRLNSEDINFMAINQSIFEQMQINKNNFIDEDILKSMEWNEKIKRTYHVSRNHLTATFDMLDFIIRNNGSHLDISETPLGMRLIDDHSFTKEDILMMKDRQIFYINDSKGRRLVNILDEANGLSIEECINMLKNLEF